MSETIGNEEPSAASDGYPSIFMIEPLRLFICSRWSYDDPDPDRTWSWYGALLILAVDEKSAREVFLKSECTHGQPRMVECVQGVFGSGEARVIYNDECR